MSRWAGQQYRQATDGVRGCTERNLNHFCRLSLDTAVSNAEGSAVGQHGTGAYVTVPAKGHELLSFFTKTVCAVGKQRVTFRAWAWLPGWR